LEFAGTDKGGVALLREARNGLERKRLPDIVAVFTGWF
jgi:hypothetical protein